jgi:membrane protease YdiL (CAAX protease family)
MPRWPGPLLAVIGALAAVGSLGAAVLVDEGRLAIADPSILVWWLVGGAVLFAAGLTYVAVRQLQVRRHLPPERYRGPAILLLLVLSLVIAGILSLPFAEDSIALVTGEGDLSFLGSVVLLVSTQAVLVGVTWLLVLRPRALAGWPSWTGPDPLGAVRAGLGWGVVAWVGSTVVSAIVVGLLEWAGVETDPQAAEQALLVIDPWLAVFAVVILAPIAEELFFRGVVFNAWLREGGIRYAYLGSAALFAVIHLSAAAVVPIFLLGLALAWVYRRTANLLAPIAMHATVNGITVAILLLVRFEVIRLPA